VVFGASMVAGMGHNPPAQPLPSWEGVAVIAGGVFTALFGLLNRKS
jgi:hypothetical protein